MFRPVVEEPQPYVLKADERKKTKDPSHVVTTWWIKPMDAVATRLLTFRLEQLRGSTGSLVQDAALTTKADREQLEAVLVKVENALDEGDFLETPEQIALLVSRIGHFDLQELLLAAMETSRLGEKEKNS